MRSAIRVFFSLAALTVAVSASADPLALVPNDAVTVGVVRLSQLRTSPLSGKIFLEADRMAVDGDAARFLADTGLDPAKDVDLLVLSLAPKAALAEGAEVLLHIEGRFDANRVAAAVAQRGAGAAEAGGRTYFRMEPRDGEAGAIALIRDGVALAGSESAVVEALQALRAGGTNFRAASSLGHELGRIDESSSAWVLVDVPRASRLQRESFAPADRATRPEAVAAALRMMSVIALSANDRGDAFSFSATALSTDAETRQLVEDAARGVLAAWRIAAQEKSPDLVPLIRKFEVARDGAGVTLTGTLPASALETLRKSSSK